jgi:hypothetical protein
LTGLGRPQVTQLLFQQVAFSLGQLPRGVIFRSAAFFKQ